MPRLLSFHPLIYYILGLGVAALAVSVIWRGGQEASERADALAGAPPALTQLSAFDAAADVGAANEVLIEAQINLGALAVIRFKRGAEEVTRTIAPLFAENAAEAPDRVTALLYETDGALDEAALAPILRGDGPASALETAARVEINGALTPLARRSRRVIEEALGAKGLTLAEDAILINPFLEGREAALGARAELDSLALYAAFSGFLIFGYGLFRSWWTRRRR